MKSTDPSARMPRQELCLAGRRIIEGIMHLSHRRSIILLYFLFTLGSFLGSKGHALRAERRAENPLQRHPISYRPMRHPVPYPLVPKVSDF